MDAGNTGYKMRADVDSTGSKLECYAELGREIKGDHPSAWLFAPLVTYHPGKPGRVKVERLNATNQSHLKLRRPFSGTAMAAAPFTDC